MKIVHMQRQKNQITATQREYDVLFSLYFNFGIKVTEYKQVDGLKQEDLTNGGE